MTLIGSNEKDNTLTLFLSIDGYDLVQLTFEWQDNWWMYKNCIKVMDFKMKQEHENAKEYIKELNKKYDEGVKQFAELLFENGIDRKVK